MIRAETADAVRKVASMCVDVRESWEVMIWGVCTEERVNAVPKRVPVRRGARRWDILVVDAFSIALIELCVVGYSRASCQTMR